MTQGAKFESVDMGLDGLKILTPVRFGDDRGFFSEVYSKRRFAEVGVTEEFVQDNHSMSAQRGIVRGLHFQIAPFEQAKLIRVVRGAIFDVAVDLRHGSASFGRWVSCVLSDENWRQFYIPAGFAHGFCTLEPNTQVIYKTSSYFAPDHERGILWNDPSLNIDWPIAEGEATLSERDRSWPALCALEGTFADGRVSDE